MNRPDPPGTSTRPTLWKSWIFLCKAAYLRFRRGWRNLSDPRLRAYPRAAGPCAWPILAESVTPLWTSAEAGERDLLAGKVHNLRILLRRIDGMEAPAGGMFSFWKQAGRALRLRGYVAGRELREGCVVPVIGGGICQLSNALYDCAARAGFAIEERHTHTRIIPGSLAETGRDATVFWNYLDLRFSSQRPFRIEADMDSDSLRVRLRGVPAPSAPEASVSIGLRRTLSLAVPNDCGTCGAVECFRHRAHVPRETGFGRSAWLVDEYWPEFDVHMRERSRPEDVLALPLDGRRWGLPQYAWSAEKFARRRSGWPVALRRAWVQRRLSGQGAERQRALLGFQDSLAARYAHLLGAEITHITVMQGLLPFLWREGFLGGRTFDVLMTALPLAALHRRLDEAAARHPGSPTLGDFRGPESRVRIEAEALAQARRILTPHAEIASLFPGRAMRLEWSIPRNLPVSPVGAVSPGKSGSPGPAGSPRKVGSPFTVAFPASTLGRKGAYELRAALRDSGMRLRCAGPVLEGGDFWDGIPMEPAVGADWLAGADVVALPAYVEHRPRRLLQALARGIPVIATAACGLGERPGVTLIPAGDPDALRAALQRAYTGP